MRVRPLNSKELSISNFETIRVLDSKVIVLMDPQNEFEPEDVRKYILESVCKVYISENRFSGTIATEKDNMRLIMHLIKTHLP